MININQSTFSYKNSKYNSIQDINMDILKGRVILLCGKSGSGKTTITRLINGLIPNYYEGGLEGEISLKGEDITRWPMYKISKLVGSVFQNPRTQFFNVDTNSELSFDLENQGVKADLIIDRINKVVKKLRIEDLLNRDIFALSGGEKQLIACTSVLVSNPEIVVLDEPSSNLDINAINRLKQIIEIWKKQGKTVVIAEHRLYYLKNLIDCIIYMDSGKIKHSFSEKEILDLTVKESNELGIRRLDLKYNIKSDFKKKEIQRNNIKFKKIKFSYNTDKSNDVTIDIDELIVPQNEIIAIIGLNGSGKSTFSRCICGLEKKCKGEVYYNGNKYNRKDMIKNTYIVMQDVNHQLFTETVKDELAISNSEIDENGINRILKRLNLLDKKNLHPMSLSGGEKQRVAIATALISNRDILIFDEPTSGLDLNNMKEVAYLLKELKKNKTIFIVTHDYELVMECCKHVVHIDRGSIKFNYTLDEKGVEKLEKYFEIE